MQPSKVTISKETREAAAAPLSFTARTNLQRESILAHIRSKPTGADINVRDMGLKIGLTGNRLIQLPLFLKRMVRDGYITMDGQKGTEYRQFSILTDVKTTKPEPQPAAKTAEVVKHKVEVHTLGQYAKEFAWDQNSDSLREFVQWMDGKELDLRRQIDGGGGTS